MAENTIVDDQLEIEAMSMNNASKKNGKNEEKSNIIRYETTSIDASSEAARESALRELKILQQHCIADYKEWANQEVKYTDLTDDAKMAASKMKRCNDSYTMSMLMQCVTPLTEGLDGSSIMASFMTYKIAEMMNPSLKQDASRLLANFRNEVSPMIDNLSKESPILGKLAKPLGKVIDANMEVPAGQLMVDELRKSEREGTIDDLSMTPRQLAALKLNFMEQYYVDVRSYDPSYSEDKVQLEILKEKYNTAMEHVATIATNGGYDMSVVAAEERYLVGIKTLENPNYLNLFHETQGAYGAKPELTESEYFDGKFVTGDGHEYTVGGDVGLDGAFTVRIPNIKNTQDDVCSRSREFAAMIGFVKSDMCPISDKEKKAVIKSIEADIHEYEKSTLVLLKDDGVKHPKAFWKKNFEESFDSEYAAASVAGADYFKENLGCDFKNEFAHVVDKYCLTKLGVEGVDVSTDFSSDSSVAGQIVDLAKKRDKNDPRFVKDANGNIDVIASADAIREDMRMHFVSEMTPDEIKDLMIHVGANMAQGKNKRDSYSRTSLEDESTKADNIYVKGDDATTPGAGATNVAKTERNTVKSSNSARVKEAEGAESSVVSEGSDEVDGPDAE